MKISKIFLDSFSAPLQNKVVPTPSELNNWLVKDQTNTIQYNDDFVCTHFANTLALQARAQHWQMGVSWLYGYYTNTHKEWSHALNLVITTEGLVYIDPQMDLWWYANQCEIRAGNNYLMSYFNPPCNVHIDRIVPIALP